VDNAALNGLALRFTITDHSLSRLPHDEKFTIITANLRYPTLVRLCGIIVSRLASAGSLVLSGIKSDEQAFVMAVYDQKGFACRWQATEKGTAVDRDYFLSFDPFIGDPAAKSRSTSGQTPPVVLADFARRGTTDGKRLVFKYTVVPKDEDCPLLDPKIIVGD
jgi:hypothetical protein